jgi:hypothetical protein
MKQEGIHRVIVPPTVTNAIAIVVLIASVLMQWPSLRWVASGSLALGLLAAAGLILWHRRSRGAPPAARLNFPPDAN